jgi:glutamyl/glutaminyl-tRNA synthetase
VNNPDGEKLSKQTGAIAFDRGDNDLLSEALKPAATFLGLTLPSGIQTSEQFWQAATAAWAAQYPGIYEFTMGKTHQPDNWLFAVTGTRHPVESVSVRAEQLQQNAGKTGQTDLDTRPAGIVG